MQKIDIYNDETFAKKVISAAYDYLAEGASYRKVAPLYNTSYVTIKSWFDKYLSQLDPELYREVRTEAEERREKTIDDPEVRKRIAKAIAYITENDYTIAQIASKLEVGSWTIYIDLVKRLPKIKDLSDQYYESVRKALTNHSIANSPMLKNKQEQLLNERK
ncbi:MAG: hypothetical protein E7164_00275 [Firmicutes bacterium]|nr:hypothetical protein [Bacillota bacterium]